MIFLILFLLCALVVSIVKTMVQVMLKEEYDEWARPLAMRLTRAAGRINRGYRDEWIAELTYAQQVEDNPGMIFALSLLAGSPKLLIFEMRRAAFGHHPLASAPKIQVAAKRALDLILSAGMLLVVLPLLLFTAVAVLLSSPHGPVLFRQQRVGRNGKTFTSYKFRTMHIDRARSGNSQPRVTVVGSFPRRSSLDEVPQLFSVLTGRMSLVGPRPEPPFVVDRYDERQRRRLTVKPGITGLWQVSGSRSSTLTDQIDRDLEYVESWTFWTDFKLLLKTIPAVLRERRGGDE